MDVTFRSGDTLWHYSQLFYIPLVLIIDSNRGLDQDAIPVGTMVKIPGFTTIQYTIEQGDTLWKLARTYNLDIDALLLLNPHLHTMNIPIGTRLTIPKRITTPIIYTNKPYDFYSLQKDLQVLQHIYPFIQLSDIGKSVLNLPLYMLKLGRSSRKVQVNASFHGNEWITTAVLMKFLNDYLLALTNSNSIKGIQALTLYFRSKLFSVPLVNPDGVNLVLNGPPQHLTDKLIQLNDGKTDFSNWKANINGVDLNKQFPANWEIEKSRKPNQPGPRDFPGNIPISEPETKAMANFVETKNFERLICLHTQGEEIYWGYEGLEPTESEILAKDFERVSGYQALQTIDSHAGYRDWFIQTFKKPGFTIELGKGTNPLPLSQFDQIASETSNILVRALV